ncbi:hypothetical protein [Streptomyces sp. G-5]|uniref:hypothetical protein n=1 Tax=Streptomyces TaxID=1883 RepID=UPI0039779E09
MQITRSSIDTVKGPADWFTGDVCVDAVIANGELDRARAETGEAIELLGTAEELAQAVHWLSRDGAGIAVPVDGGCTAR